LGLAIRRLDNEMQFVMLTKMADHFESVTGERVVWCGDAN